MSMLTANSLMMKRETAWDGNIMAISRRCGKQDTAMATWRRTPWEWRDCLQWQCYGFFGGGMAVRRWQRYCISNVMANSSTMDRVTACNGNAMANWRWRGSVALMTILHGQCDGKLTKKFSLSPEWCNLNHIMFPGQKYDPTATYQIFWQLKIAMHDQYLTMI